QTAPRTQWDRIALVMLVGIVAAFHVGKVPSALPEIRLDFGIGMVSAGWIVSVYTGTAVVLALASGVLADRLGHRNTLLGGLLLLAAGSAAGSAMDTQPALVAMRIVEGVGFVLIVVSAPSLILRAAAPRDHSFSLGIWAAFMPIGVTGMLLVAPFVLTQFGWRGLWQLNAAIPLATFVVVLAMLRQPAPPGAPRSPAGRIWSDLRLTVARPGPWVLSLSFAMFGAQFATLTSWLPTFLIEVQGRTTAQAAGMTAMVVSLTAVGAFAGGWILGRGVPRWVLLAICGLLTGPLGLGTFAVGLPVGLSYAAALGLSLVGGFIPAVILASVPDHAPSLAQIGATNGILLHGANFGPLLGPPVFAAVVSGLGGWTAGGVFLFILGLISLFLALVIRRIERGMAAQRGDKWEPL
ncbi:MAG: MFS transporter, partial [Proteobacteria bacterium]|nr:MFS transporter [Pseudomonadota bacterium]